MSSSVIVWGSLHLDQNHTRVSTKLCFIMLYDCKCYFLCQAGIFSALMTSIKSCKNFKVRISATSALSVPNKRIVYGDLYVGVWDDLVGVLAALEEAADFSEFQYQQNLKDQVSLRGPCSYLLKRSMWWSCGSVQFSKL